MEIQNSSVCRDNKCKIGIAKISHDIFPFSPDLRNKLLPLPTLASHFVTPTIRLQKFINMGTIHLNITITYCGW